MGGHNILAPLTRPATRIGSAILQSVTEHEDVIRDGWQRGRRLVKIQSLNPRFKRMPQALYRTRDIPGDSKAHTRHNGQALPAPLAPQTEQIQCWRGSEPNAAITPYAASWNDRPHPFIIYGPELNDVHYYIFLSSFWDPRWPRISRQLSVR